MHQVVLLDHDAPVGPDDGSRGTDKTKVTHGVHSTDIDMFSDALPELLELVRKFP